MGARVWAVVGGPTKHHCNGGCGVHVYEGAKGVPQLHSKTGSWRSQWEGTVVVTIFIRL